MNEQRPPLEPRPHRHTTPVRPLDLLPRANAEINADGLFINFGIAAFVAPRLGAPRAARRQLTPSAA
jgi:hypothetical protein